MRTSSECVREADRCEKLSTVMDSEELRTQLRGIARIWRNMTDSQIEPRHYLHLMDMGVTPGDSPYL